VIESQHGIYFGIPAYAMASFVGLSRINDNKHYLFDVLAGSLVGTMYGLSISHRDQNSQVSYNWIPSLGHNEVGINYQVLY
jgi:hypothetical protein